MTLSKILIYLSYFSVLAPLITALVKGKFWGSAPMRVMSILLVLSAASDITSYVLAKMHVSNLPIINTYFIVSFALLSVFYAALTKKYQSVILLVGSILLFYFIITSFDNWGSFRSINTAIQSVTLICLAVLYYFKLHKHLPADNLLRFAPMWFNSGIFFYYSFNLFLFLIANYVFENTSADVAPYFGVSTISTTS